MLGDYPQNDLPTLTNPAVERTTQKCRTVVRTVRRLVDQCGMEPSSSHSCLQQQQQRLHLVWGDFLGCVMTECLLSVGVGMQKGRKAFGRRVVVSVRRGG